MKGGMESFGAFCPCFFAYSVFSLTLLCVNFNNTISALKFLITYIHTLSFLLDLHLYVYIICICTYVSLECGSLCLYLSRSCVCIHIWISMFIHTWSLYMYTYLVYVYVYGSLCLYMGSLYVYVYGFVYVCMHVPPSIPHMDHVYIGSVHMCMYTDSYMYAGASIHPTYEIRI